MSNRFLRHGILAQESFTHPREDESEMTLREIDAPHQRLFITDPRAATVRTGPQKPGFAARLMLGMLLIPLGFALRVMTQIWMEITQQAVDYLAVVGFVMLGHLVLAGVSLAAVMAHRRHPVLGVVAVQIWIGYGIGAALLALKDLG